MCVCVFCFVYFDQNQLLIHSFLRAKNRSGIDVSGYENMKITYAIQYMINMCVNRHI